MAKYFKIVYLLFQAKHLIMAIPPSLLNRIEFSPPLAPTKLQLIQRVPMGSIIKTTMYYETPFWRDLGIIATF